MREVHVIVNVVRLEFMARKFSFQYFKANYNFVAR